MLRHTIHGTVPAPMASSICRVTVTTNLAPSLPRRRVSVAALGHPQSSIAHRFAAVPGILVLAALRVHNRRVARPWRYGRLRWRPSGTAGSSGWQAERCCTCLAASTELEPNKKQQLCFGSWESPITAKFVIAASVGLSSLKCSPTGTLYWLEARPQEGGRQVVCREAHGKEMQNGDASERGGVDATPPGSNARTRVHEYGGGAYVLGPDGDGVIYSNFVDQRLYWARTGGTVTELTPRSAYVEDNRFRFADGIVDVARARVICVREDHTDRKPANVVNTICAVALDGSGSMEVLVSSHDFYAAPRLSPDGMQLAYICWDHPNMPWDATELQVATLDDFGTVSSTKSICGGVGKSTSVLQPSWSPEGALHFISDETGWWNLYRYDNDCKFTNLYPYNADFSGPAPGWVLGVQNYCFLMDGSIVTCYEDRMVGASQLIILMSRVASEGGDIPALPVGSNRSLLVVEEFGPTCLPRTITGLCPSSDGKILYFLGSDPDTPSGIYSWTIPDDKHASDPKVAPAEMIACSASEDMRIDPAFVSCPRLLRFPTGGYENAYGYYYAPTNPHFEAPSDAKPPLLVKAHGGPTACARISLNPSIQFWTSRGFAVLDVDYRGSTGYGRHYREQLKRNWGIIDIEDVCAGAEYLVKEGLADPKCLAIDGGSAGGFTTLGALTFRDVFTAGCSLYGVADLAALATDTHKFESRYLEGLVGKYPEDQEAYNARAPIKHIEQLSCPILLLQGAEDKIVPPNQAEMMYAAVKAQGLPCALKIYAEEQHGFRRSENIMDALDSELVFFARVFGFKAAGKDLPVVEIANFDTESDFEAP